MRTSLEILAELPPDGCWPSHAIAVALRGEPIPGLPESLAVLGTSRWSFAIDDTDGEQPDAPWIFGSHAPVDDHVVDLVRRHGVTATEVAWFAANEHGPYPQALLATWSPGDRDAIIQVLWSDGMGRDEARLTTLGPLNDWLSRTLEQMFVRDLVGGSRVTAPAPFHDALEATMRAAAALRREVQHRLNARVEEIQRSVDAASGAADDEILVQWDDAERRLAQIRRRPWLWDQL